jgi:hypothetical protein
VSQSSALTKAKALKAVMLDYGVPEVSIELQTGRPNPYDSWDGLFVVIDMSHHIVSNYNSSNLTPLLWLVKQGRTSVPGPLANGYGGWDLCYRILCFSYANHPGAGGPMTVPRVGGGTYTIPKDSARRYAWGTEYEGGVVEADWDRLLKNPRNGRRMTMREFMGRAGAAIHDYFNIHGGAHAEHSTWAPLRKIDRLRYDKSEGAAEERQYADAPLEDDDMFTDADRALLQRLNQVITSNSDDKVDRPDTATGTAGMRFAAQETWEDTHSLTAKRAWQSAGVSKYVAEVIDWKDPNDPTKGTPVTDRYILEVAFSIIHRMEKAQEVAFKAVNATLAESLGASPDNNLSKEEWQALLDERLDAAFAENVVKVDLTIQGELADAPA